MDSPGPDTPLCSVAAVARHTGVPAVTLRAWERRYGFPHPSRASGGRRLYTQRDIWTVRALRGQTDQGVPISRAIALVRDTASSPVPAADPIGDRSPLTTLAAPALAAAGLVALNAAFVAVCLPESLAADRRSHLPLRGQINPLGVLTRLVSRPSLRVPLVATFLVNFAFAGFQTNFAVYVGDRFGFGPLDVGTLFLALGLTSIVMQGLVLRRLSVRYSDRTILLAGILVSAAGYALIGSVPNALLLWAALPVLAAGSSLWRAPLSSLISKLVGPREQGQASGGSQAMSSLASIVGPLAAGLAYVQVGQATPYVLAALVMTLTAMLVVRGQPRHSTATASAVRVSLPAPLAEQSA